MKSDKDSKKNTKTRSESVKSGKHYPKSLIEELKNNKLYNSMKDSDSKNTKSSKSGEPVKPKKSKLKQAMNKIASTFKNISSPSSNKIDKDKSHTSKLKDKNNKKDKQASLSR